MTLLQQHKEQLAKIWTKEAKAKVRKEMRQAHKAGQDVSLMATCPTTYAIALKVKYSK